MARVGLDVSFNYFAWNKNQYGSILDSRFNPFQVNVPFLYAFETSENWRFLTFSGGIEMENWPETG